MPTSATHTYLDAIRHLPAGGGLSLPDVSWADYEALLTELGDGYAVRVTYDRGRLEIVSPSTKHEAWKEFILRVADALAGALGTNFESFGSTTLKDPTIEQGVEPDTCFYVQHAAAIVGKDVIDPMADPPDVVVEVDVAHSSAHKLAIYAQLGVPEVWRYDGERAVMYERSGDGYREIPASLAFPPFTAETLTGLLHRLQTEGQQAVLTGFRNSLRR